MKLKIKKRNSKLKVYFEVEKELIDIINQEINNEAHDLTEIAKSIISTLENISKEETKAEDKTDKKISSLKYAIGAVFGKTEEECNELVNSVKNMLKKKSEKVKVENTMKGETDKDETSEC